MEVCITVARGIWARNRLWQGLRPLALRNSIVKTSRARSQRYTINSARGQLIPQIHESHPTKPPSAKTEQRRTLAITDLEKAKRGRERIVILGSGWAGFSMARALDHEKFQVIIVSPRSYFVFTPLLASTSVGTLEFRTAMEPIRSKRNRSDYVQGWGDDVNFQKKTITVEEAVLDPAQGLALVSSRNEGKSGETMKRETKEKTAKGHMFDVEYDKLVVAVGCYAQTFNTPGVKEYASFLKDVGDARKIRKQILHCFEGSELPTMTDELRRQFLNFAIVGGGPTGMETAAELHDFISQDLSKLYPSLIKFVSITVYDVAPTVLGAFDEKLVQYATKHFKREGIAIKTSRHIQRLSSGLPGSKGTGAGYTLSFEEEGDIGVGMCIWSTGLMMNPFIKGALSEVLTFPTNEVIYKEKVEDAEKVHWTVCRDQKSGSLITNDRMRLILEAEEPGADEKPTKAAYMRDVFAIGDCAMIDGTPLPATAQVASQKGEWLAKRLNKGDLQTQRFRYRNLGVMAYLGNRSAIVQGPESGFGNISGRAAWLIWRGAYLVKSLSWRNRILIPIYWTLNWAFGRDVSRF